MKLYDFSQPAYQVQWRSLDDWVMGGRSSSQMQFCDRGAHFTGTVSLANDGGFASIQSPSTNLDLSSYEGISLNVCGDGKRYGFILRDGGHQQLRYQASFKTEKGKWQQIYLPFYQFMPMVMGQQLSFSPSLNRGAIQMMGLIIADDQMGKFSLHIQSIDAIRLVEPQPVG